MSNEISGEFNPDEVNKLALEDEDDDGRLRQGDACPECGYCSIDITVPGPPEYLASDEEIEHWYEEQDEVASCHHCGYRSDE